MVCGIRGRDVGVMSGAIEVWGVEYEGLTRRVV